MWRYIVASLAIGLCVSLVLIAFDGAGLFPWLGAHLGRFYAGAEWTTIPEPAVLLRPLQYAVIVTAAFGVAWVVIDTARVRSRLIVIVGALLVIAAASPVLALYGILFEPYSGCIAVIAAALAAVIYAQGETARRKRVFLELVAGRMSDESMAALAAAPYDVKFNGAGREVSVLVCRILNQDEIRVNLRAREAIELGSFFLDGCAAKLVQSGAYLDQREPDGVRFYFGLPLADKRHSLAACEAALVLREHLEEIARECDARWSQPVQWGVGLDTGAMTVGLFGDGGFARFSALGSQVEVAQRLSSANGNYGSSILVSGGMMAAVGEAMEFRVMDMLRDDDAERSVEIYELLCGADDLDATAAARRDAFWHGVIRFREGDDEAALAEFEKARPVGREDRAVEYYVGRVKARMGDGDRSGRRETT